MSAEFDVKMTKKWLYDFMMTHTYRSFAGWFSIIIGAAGLILTLVTYKDVSMMMTVVYALFSVYFLLYQPITLYMKCATAVKTNPLYKNVITYTVSDEGITSRQGEQCAEISWEQIQKVTETKYSLLLYTGKRTSFVLPRESIGTQITVVEGLMKKHLKPEQMKIK